MGQQERYTAWSVTQQTTLEAVFILSWWLHAGPTALILGKRLLFLHRLTASEQERKNTQEGKEKTKENQ